MGARGTVFLVEDSPELRFLYRLMLEPAGYDLVGEAATGAEALEQVEGMAPNAIVLDLLLPDVHGIDLIDRFRALVPGVKIVVCTGTRREVATETGGRADTWLEKTEPFELVPVLNRLLA